MIEVNNINCFIAWIYRISEDRNSLQSESLERMPELPDSSKDQVVLA